MSSDQFDQKIFGPNKNESKFKTKHANWKGKTQINEIVYIKVWKCYIILFNARFICLLIMWLNAKNPCSLFCTNFIFRISLLSYHQPRKGMLDQFPLHRCNRSLKLLQCPCLIRWRFESHQIWQQEVLSTRLLLF